MKRFFLVAYVFLLLFGCKQTETEDYSEFILTGKLESDTTLTLTLEELTTCDINVLDSTETDASGNFVFRRELNDAGFFIVRESRNNFITLLIEPGENIRITAEANNLALTYEVKGSKGSSLIKTLNNQLYENISKVDSLADLYRESRYKPDFEEIHEQLNIQYTEIFEGHRRFVKQFIKENPHSLASIIALYQYFGDKIIMNEMEDYKYFKKLSESLAEVYPSNRHVINLKRRVSDINRRKVQRQISAERLAPGNPAPEIVLPDPDGNSVALSSLKGNVVLIDFWASWHDPSIMNIEILRRLYNKYNHNGFEIYSVSLDRTRTHWTKAIEESNIDWIQVSDLRYFNSPVVSLYNIDGIPYNVLIDREGNIVAKGIDYRNLEDYLNELL